jgi:hypothetical protein
LTAADRPVFSDALEVLCETFAEPMSDLRAEAYFAALSDFTVSQVNLAVMQAIRTLKFFPKPSELRELIAGTPGDGADSAWSEVLDQVRRVGYMGSPAFTDERILRTVNELWGSWRRLCETLPGEGPELLGWVKQFKAAFATQDRRAAHRQLTMAALDPNVRKFIVDERRRLAIPERGMP